MDDEDEAPYRALKMLWGLIPKGVQDLVKDHLNEDDPDAYEALVDALNL